MKTQLDWDPMKYQFKSKRSILSLHMVREGENVMETVNNGTSVVLGEADFDLAYFANNPNVLQKKLPLSNCSLDPEACIEIHIKTNS